METQNNLSQIRWLYHFTDIRNLPSIKERGGVYSTAMLRAKGINTFYPGGNELSLVLDQQIGMDQYVHLCFRPNHPMAHIAKNEGRIQRPIYLPVDPSIIQLPGVRYSAGVAIKTGVHICDIAEAADIIDYQVLYTRMDWNVAEIQERLQAAEKCEILVPDYVPMKYLEKYFPNGLLPNG
jgi:hypothetical protein